MAQPILDHEAGYALLDTAPIGLLASLRAMLVAIGKSATFIQLAGFLTRHPELVADAVSKNWIKLESDFLAAWAAEHQQTP